MTCACCCCARTRFWLLSLRAHLSTRLYPRVCTRCSRFPTPHVFGIVFGCVCCPLTRALCCVCVCFFLRLPDTHNLLFHSPPVRLNHQSGLQFIHSTLGNSTSCHASLHFVTRTGLGLASWVCMTSRFLCHTHTWHASHQLLLGHRCSWSWTWTHSNNRQTTLFLSLRCACACVAEYCALLRFVVV